MLRSHAPPVEILESDEMSPPVTRTASVQEIFSNSAFKHLGTTNRVLEIPGVSERSDI